MAEPSFETLFGSCTLEVAVPDASVGFPDRTVADEWLANIRDPGVERRQAFFDEQLHLFLIISVNHPPHSRSRDSLGPTAHFVDFLRHVQVSFEATYISQKSASCPETPQKAQPVAPRTSPGPNKPTSLHPTIFPPTTPNPIPSTTKDDRKYVQSEGTLLLSAIWGHRPPEQSGERFALLFSESQGTWVAVYEVALAISFLRLPFSDPLLCLTTSATLREKALSLSDERHPLIAFLVQRGLINSQDTIQIGSPTHHVDTADDEQNDVAVLEEINLLEGLAIGSGLSSEPDPLHLPSTRLGTMTRRQFFLLPAVSCSPEPMSVDSGSKRGPPHVLRKSFRKVLKTASGFRIRMRTVFVPHILIQKDQSILCVDGDHDEDEEREVGNSERTVVLCIEVENSGESGRDVGFSLESVDVEIGGEGATARLIGWGEGACDSNIEERIFPLLLGPSEQYNLLYIVSFLNTISDQDGFLLGAPSAELSMELQRAVTISIQGRPYLANLNRIEGDEDSDILSYSTRGFVSRWNCVLDLSSRPGEEQLQEQPSGSRTAFPEPPSPFPGALSVFTPPPTAKPAPQAVAGKRPANNIMALRAVNPSVSPRLSIPPREHTGSPTPTGRPSSTPFTTLQAFAGSQPVVLGMSPGARPSESHTRAFVTPQTDALPAFPPNSGVNDTSSTQTRGSLQGFSRPSVELQRDWDRNSASRSALPATHGRLDATKEALSTPREPVIVSVGLIPTNGPSERIGQRRIYPSDVFTLDIFVFNQSSWIKRFEITYPDAGCRPRQSKKQSEDVQGHSTRLQELKSSMTSPGILPLQNRIRVGPLRPSTCQSVRLDFLALSPGVHTIDVLTITDIETGYSMNLQSVMDVVVHEHSESGGWHS